MRQRGYATAQEELEQGLNAVAVPVHDQTGHIVAAVSVAGLEYRVTPELLPLLAVQLEVAARDISKQLGCRRGKKPGL